jgi:hypothetical protein
MIPPGGTEGGRRGTAPAATPMSVARRPATPPDVLRSALLATVDMLHRRRARDIPEGYIDDYVALHWLEWHGGGLRLTTTGENVCRQMRLLSATPNA